MTSHSISKLASAVYAECFGHLDDKNFRAEKTQEITDWLTDGDLQDLPADFDAAVADCAAEWREYDAADPNIR